MKKIIIVTLLLVSAISLNAQNYKWAIGLRGGVCSSGITFKINFNPKGGLDAALNYGYWQGEQAVSLSANYEWSTPVIAKGFSVFYGCGAFAGNKSWKEVDKEGTETKYKTYGIGAQGIVGLEYKIPNFPLAIDLHYQPTLSVLSSFKFYWANVAIGVKFAF